MLSAIALTKCHGILNLRKPPLPLHQPRFQKQLEGRSINMISPDEGQLIQFMVRAVGVRKAIEIGRCCFSR